MDESLKNTDENISYGIIESYVQQDGIGLALFSGSHQQGDGSPPSDGLGEALHSSMG
mgnify:FL=1